MHVGRGAYFAGAAFTLIALAGCGRSEVQTGVRVDNVVPLTTQAITELLLGPEPEPTRTAPADKPLLTKTGYESVVIAFDADDFVRVSRGAFRVEDVAKIQKKVVEKVNDNLKKRGFAARGVTGFPPPPVTEPKTLLLTITPATQESGSPTDRASGKAKTLVLIRLTVTDPLTKTVLAAREYYSGSDVKTGGRKIR